MSIAKLQPNMNAKYVAINGQQEQNILSIDKNMGVRNVKPDENNYYLYFPCWQYHKSAAVFKYIFTERESAMTDKIQLRWQFALAIVDSI